MLNKIDEQISVNYDGEMSDYELIYFEARKIKSPQLKEYVESELYKYFKITNSIRLAKYRMNKNAETICNKVIENNKLLFYVNPAGFKRVDKRSCRLSLDFGWNNS